MPPGYYEIAYNDINGYYAPQNATRTLNAGQTITFNGQYSQIFPGDFNKNGTVGLDDLIIVLQLLSNINQAVTLQPGMDADGDSKIGLSDAIYILQKLAEIR